jgi:hypothetical protein
MSRDHPHPTAADHPALARFVRFAGLLLVTFGVLMILFRVAQFLILGDPPLDELVQHPLFLPLQGLPGLAAAVAFLLGITGLYLRQAERSGTLGLIAYLLAFFAVSVSAGVMWAYAFAGPPIARHAPQLLTDVSAGLTVPILLSLSLGQLGWLLMGVTALRARVIPRWASWLLIGSVLLLFVLAPLATSQLARLAYNTLLGLGPLAVGYVLWRTTPDDLSSADTRVG